MTDVTYIQMVTIVTLRGGDLIERHKTKYREAELEVMKILWQEKSPVTTGVIYKALFDKMDWDRSTVRTLLKRLSDKGRRI